MLLTKEKQTPVNGEPWVSANQPSNNWAQDFKLAEGTQKNRNRLRSQNNDTFHKNHLSFTVGFR